MDSREFILIIIIETWQPRKEIVTSKEENIYIIIDMIIKITN